MVSGKHFGVLILVYEHGIMARRKLCQLCPGRPGRRVRCSVRGLRVGPGCCMWQEFPVAFCFWCWWQPSPPPPPEESEPDPDPPEPESESEPDPETNR